MIVICTSSVFGKESSQIFCHFLKMSVALLLRRVSYFMCLVNAFYGYVFTNISSWSVACQSGFEVQTFFVVIPNRMGSFLY